MNGNYTKPSELLRLLKETGKSYWDLIGLPLTAAELVQEDDTYNDVYNEMHEDEGYQQYLQNLAKLLLPQLNASEEDIYDILQEYKDDYRSLYDNEQNTLPQYQDGKNDNFDDWRYDYNYNVPESALKGIAKATLARYAHFGHPTAKRIVGDDSGEYYFKPGEISVNGGQSGNVYVGYLDNLVVPQILKINNELLFVKNPFSLDNIERTLKQSIKFNTEKEAEYFTKHYKELSPYIQSWNGLEEFQKGKDTGKGVYQSYVEKMFPLYAREYMTRGYNINDAVQLASLAARLSAWESQYGQSKLAKTNLNFAGFGHKDDGTYRKYETVEDFVKDHVGYLVKNGYDKTRDVKSYVTRAKKLGYFTDTLDHYLSNMLRMKQFDKYIGGAQLLFMDNYNKFENNPNIELQEVPDALKVTKPIVPITPLQEVKEPRIPASEVFPLKLTKEEPKSILPPIYEFANAITSGNYLSLLTPKFKIGKDDEKNDLNSWKTGDAAYIGNNTFTDQCALFANYLLNSNGYNISGNAWNPNQMSLLFSGYDTSIRPKTYNLNEVVKYNEAATQNFYNNFNSKEMLDKDKVYRVNMFYRGSNKQQEAFENARDGVAGSHTGVVVWNPTQNRWNVIHNIHGKVYVDKFTNIQNPKNQYGITAIYEPRNNNIINNALGSIIRAFGGSYNIGKDSGIYINPKNKGKFSKSAKQHGMSTLAFARQVLANKKKYSSTMVKRANFARNASKWNH